MKRSFVNDSFSVVKLRFLDSLLHCGNSVGMLIDLLVSAHHFRWFHFIYSCAVGIAYLIFTAIYYLSEQRCIYDVLNWKEPASTIAHAIVLLIITAAIHLIVCIIQRLRIKIHGILYKETFEITI